MSPCMAHEPDPVRDNTERLESSRTLTERTSHDGRALDARCGM